MMLNLNLVLESFRTDFTFSDHWGDVFHIVFP